MSEHLLERLARGPLAGDGAMGTQLIGAGLQPGESGERWNVEHPERVAEIHKRYRAAGCDLITTNTFQGTTTCLAQHGLDGQCEAINKAGARNARSVDDDAIVLADIGPFGGFLEPLGDTTESQLTDIFTQQVTALLEGGADVALVETMSDPNEVAVAIKAAKAAGAKAVIATYAYQHAGDGYATMMGTDIATAVAAAIDAGADVVGANCGTALTLDDYRALGKQLVDAAADTPVIVQPNAGAPESVDGKLVYHATPEQMAALAGDLLDMGVRIVGGCCGTSPEHLQAIAARVHA